MEIVINTTLTKELDTFVPSVPDHIQREDDTPLLREDDTYFIRES